MAGRNRINRQRANTTSDLDDLPPCPGPKLHAFPHRNLPIEWLGRLDEDREELSESSTEGYVFKVKIGSRLYALKVVSNRLHDVEQN